MIYPLLRTREGNRALALSLGERVDRRRRFSAGAGPAEEFFLRL
jgi:hypothetical protein